MGMTETIFWQMHQSKKMAVIKCRRHLTKEGGIDEKRFNEINRR